MSSQEHIDRFYFKNGPCCAGCDWWRSISSMAGECVKTAPVSASERLAMLDIQWSSFHHGAGHVITSREHHCGDFQDNFDWSSLPIPYLRKIGAPTLRVVKS